jgi:hypothetical protein
VGGAAWQHAARSALSRPRSQANAALAAQRALTDPRLPAGPEAIVLSPLPLDGGAGAFWVNLLTARLALVGVAAISKVVLAGGGPVDPGALRVLALGLLVGGLSSGLTPLIADRSRLATSQLVVPVIALVVARSAERQRRAATGDGVTGAGPGRDRRGHRDQGAGRTALGASAVPASATAMTAGGA